MPIEITFVLLSLLTTNIWKWNQQKNSSQILRGSNTENAVHITIKTLIWINKKWNDSEHIVICAYCRLSHEMLFFLVFSMSFAKVPLQIDTNCLHCCAQLFIRHIFFFDIFKIVRFCLIVNKCKWFEILYNWFQKMRISLEKGASFLWSNVTININDTFYFVIWLCFR